MYVIVILMNTRARRDELVRLLRRRGTTTVAELVDSVGTSRRTVLRDIAALREEGFLINSSAGPGGGLSLDPTSILLTPKLTSSEGFALLLSYAVIKQTHALPFASLADSGLLKIEQSIPRDRVLQMRRILKNVYIGSPDPTLPLPIVSTINAKVLQSFELSFLESRRMNLSYKDRNGKKTKRRVDPHAILVLSPAWYIVGYDPDKSEFRHFRMDRIQSASATDVSFQRRPFTVDDGECPFTTRFV